MKNKHDVERSTRCAAEQSKEEAMKMLQEKPQKAATGGEGEWTEVLSKHCSDYPAKAKVDETQQR